MVLSGTDYNVNDCTNLFETLKWYNKYKNTQNKKTTLGFYRWLQKNTNYIDNYELLIRILNMFEIAVEPKVARHCMSLSSATPCLTK
jgi:hypothetical protein